MYYYDSATCTSYTDSKQKARCFEAERAINVHVHCTCMSVVHVHADKFCFDLLYVNRHKWQKI